VTHHKQRIPRAVVNTTRSLAGAVVAALMLAATLQAATTASGTVTINGHTYNLNGRAECLHTPRGSIYETPAAMWSVMMDGSAGGLTRLNATMWLPTAGGAAQILFQAVTPAGIVDITTVAGGTVKGHATARAERNGTGGTLIIEGRTAAGQAVAMAVSCSGFTPPEDNG
jgi:hypothetical protein